jgi:hypothetical protein
VIAAFLDTFYIFAVLDSRDDWHKAALRWGQALAAQRRPLVTMEYVLVEVADGLAKLPRRGLVDAAFRRMEHSTDLEIVPGSTDYAVRSFRNRKYVYGDPSSTPRCTPLPKISVESAGAPPWSTNGRRSHLLQATAFSPGWWSRICRVVSSTPSDMSLNARSITGKYPFPARRGR